MSAYIDEFSIKNDFRDFRGADIGGISNKKSFQKIESKTIAAPPLKPEYLPVVLSNYIFDESGRMPCLPDYIASGLIVALATVAGAKFRIKPKRLDSWMVVPNLWGAIVGSPSTKKSPATSIAMKSLREIVKYEKVIFRKASADFRIDSEFLETKYKADKKAALKQFNADGNLEEAKALIPDDKDFPEHPVERVLVCNDSTTEALGIILADNPYGLLMERDELAGFIADMNKSGREGDRAFYLSAWNGNESYNVYRISRENLYIPNVCVSVFGGIQPDKLKPLVKDSVSGSEGNDGFIQRFQVLVMPEPIADSYVDREPLKGAYDAVRKVFNRIHQIDPEDPDKPIVLGFNDDAQQLFIKWYDQNCSETASGKLPTNLEAHFSKYPSLVCSLALIFHLVESNSLDSICIGSLEKALAYSEYLKGHAKRIYALSESVDEENAITIAQKFGNQLKGEFTIAEVVRGGWKGIGKSKARAVSAVQVLVDHGYVIPQDKASTGGRPATYYLINTSVVGVHS